MTRIDDERLESMRKETAKSIEGNTPEVALNPETLHQMIEEIQMGRRYSIATQQTTAEILTFQCGALVITAENSRELRATIKQVFKDLDHGALVDLIPKGALVDISPREGY
jgi:TATA-box binding protein (TBP) (component of TFIID and TFIIIB)